MADGIFSKYERDELNKITAKGILEKLMNIRQNINVEFTARRLVWELMQNAKDNASLCNEDGTKVNIKIQLSENQFIFTHDKGYFTNEQIRGLIRKYSSSDKNRDRSEIGQSYKTTGQFGTGFMTTHLLSENVQIHSYYKNEDGTFNQFSFWLDRTGKSESDIVSGINNAFEEAEGKIGKSDNTIPARECFQTSFIYPLSEKKAKLAYIATEEVRRGVAYTLIDVPEIESVTIDDDLFGLAIYKIEQTIKFVHQGKDLLIYNVLINGIESEYYFLAISDYGVRVIVPISMKNSSYYVLKLDETIPRLHLDFPMIGTEDLNLPFVVNCSSFEPTEPRDGISLIDDKDNETSQLNCKIMLQAVDLFKIILSFIGNGNNWNDLYNLARIELPKKHIWIDKDWFKNSIVNSIREELLHIPLVDVESGGRVSIWDTCNECQVYFPYANEENVQLGIWELLKQIYPQFTPLKSHVSQWSEILWEDCYKYSISELSKDIHRRETLTNLAVLLQNDENATINFLNEYYKLLYIEENHIKEISANYYNVIPNQHGEFKKKSDLYIDREINEELKNVCSLISKDPREYLICEGIYTGEGLFYNIKNNDNIIAEINTIIKEGQNSNIRVACDYLVSLLPIEQITSKRTEIFEFSKQVNPDNFTKIRALVLYNEKIWEESDKFSLFYITSKIAEYKNCEDASKAFNFTNKDSFVKWLNTFVGFLVKEKFENNINRVKYPILPNQKGMFKVKDELFLDSGDIGEKLKDISDELGYDYRSELLDTSIFFKMPDNRTYSVINVAEKISSAIKPIIRDVDKRKKYKDVLKKFYIWMSNNKELAKIHFADLYEKKFLFLEDEDISHNIKKATELDNLMSEYGIDTINDLRLMLSKSTNASITHSPENKVDVTQDLLISLGVASLKELEEAFQNPEISDFYHSSSHTTEMFLFVQGLIQRAKNNVINYLSNHPDYDCSDIEEIAPTILAGIKKNEVDIQIVVRPSDNKEVIIYYSSEKDALDCDNAELWVDNNIDTPHLLTLGRILKSTGINKIPIKMD